MRNKRNKIFLAVVVGILVVGVGVYFVLTRQGEELPPTECLAPDEVIVTKVLDGDTVVVEGGYHVRLLGIDADESGYPFYEEAKSRLEELVLNKEVRLEKDETDVDQYDRCLRYIFLPDNQNINIQLVEEGLAIARFYPPDTKYREEITQAEKEAIEEDVGRWAFSEGTGTVKGKKTGFEWEELTTKNLGYDVVGACQAGKYLGRELIVEGRIAGAYHDLESNTVFLNFEKSYPNQCFTGVIFSSNLHKFVQNPEDYYLNKTVRIMGEVKEYESRAEIVLETSNQIEVRENKSFKNCEKTAQK